MERNIFEKQRDLNDRLNRYRDDLPETIRA